jgi:threonine synthase
LQVDGDFDDAMRLVQRVCDELGVYLLNSLNPFRLEGQKSIVFEIVQGMDWQPPDWIVLPAGNLGNTAAFGKALHELRELGLIDRLPRLASVQAEGANPFYRSFVGGFKQAMTVQAETVATAIRIGAPVSYERAVRSMHWTDGVVTQVSDADIMDAKAMVDRVGIGCEPASAAALAGVRKLVAEGTIHPDQVVVAVLTGNLLKDPGATVGYHTGEWPGASYANPPRPVAANVDAVREVLEGML